MDHVEWEARMHIHSRQRSRWLCWGQVPMGISLLGGSGLKPLLLCVDQPGFLKSPVPGDPLPSSSKAKNVGIESVEVEIAHQPPVQGRLPPRGRPCPVLLGTGGGRLFG